MKSQQPSQRALVDLLVHHGIIHSPVVIDAMAALDRALFLPPYCRYQAYNDHPVPIAADATLSAPHMHGMCLELIADILARSQAGDHDTSLHILDIGSGSGYLTAALYLVAKYTSSEPPMVVGIECEPVLVQQSRKILRQIFPQETADHSLAIHQGDGWDGFAAKAPYDAIHVGAAAPHIPEALQQQLKTGGRLVIPLGHEGGAQELTVVDALGHGEWSEKRVAAVQYVPLRAIPPRKSDCKAPPSQQ